MVSGGSWGKGKGPTTKLDDLSLLTDFPRWRGPTPEGCPLISTHAHSHTRTPARTHALDNYIKTVCGEQGGY